MSKEIVVWCTRHLEEFDQRKAATEHQIVVDGKAVTVDVCGDCDTEFLAPMRKLVDDYGEPVNGKRATKKTKTAPTVTGNRYAPNSDGEFVCDEPGCGKKFNKPQGLGRHRVSHRNG